MNNNRYFRAILIQTRSARSEVSERGEASGRGELQSELVPKLQSEYFPRIFLILTALLWLGALSGRAATGDWFVATNGTGLGTNGWADATNNLQGAITACSNGYTVWVSNGTYVGSLTNGAGVTVRSKDNDPATVILDGGYPAVTNRVVTMTTTSWLIGLTISNGLATGAIYSANASGGGIYGGTASNCIFTRNRGVTYGGGAYYSTLFNCTLSENTCGYGSSGGGAYTSTLYNCTISGNTASNGGGVASSTLSNCVLSGNAAIYGGGAYNSALNNCELSWNTNTISSSYGGGVSGGNLNNCTLASNGTSTTFGGGGAYGGTLKNCTLSANLAQNGGGTHASTLSNCTIIGNTGGNACGGANDSTLYNCMIRGNYGYNSAGGVRGSTLYNCTIYGNTSANSVMGGGARDSILYNCISWGNNVTDIFTTASSTNYYSCGVGYTGTGSITNDPLFVDAGGSNWRLQHNSPCVDTGTNQGWMTTSYDLDGSLRIRYGRVDMGAYETIYNGTFFSIP